MRRLLLFLLLVILLAGAGLAAALYLPYQGFSRQGVYVDIPRGASARTIARLLRRHGVVRSSLAFESLARWRRKRILQAGEYFFDRPATAFEVFRTLADGRIFEKSVTIPEGFTMFDVAVLLESEDLTTRQAFLDAARDPAPIRDLAPGAPSLEGFLFPATYTFPRHPSPQQIVAAMTQRFRDAWNALPESARQQGRGRVAAVVTLASLVERETSVPAERPLVAGVFTNRLRKRVPLQCDPTVIYALQLAGRYTGSLTSASLRFDSPYNTYRHAGLPPGPIANPGEAALRAALQPPDVDYFYFVANGQGGHSFSDTLKGHNRNVAQYRRMVAQTAQGHGSGSKLEDTPPAPPAKKVSHKRPR